MCLHWRYHLSFFLTPCLLLRELFFSILSELQVLIPDNFRSLKQWRLNLDHTFFSIFILVLKYFIFNFLLSNFLQILCDLAGSSQITESTYDFSVLDSNSLQFLFKHSPEAAEILNVTSEFSFKSASQSKRHDWMVNFVPLLHKYSGLYS